MSEKQFEEFVKDISFNESIDYSHKDKLEKQLINLGQYLGGHNTMIFMSQALRSPRRRAALA